MECWLPPSQPDRRSCRMSVHPLPVAARRIRMRRERNRRNGQAQWKTGPRVFRELCARGVPRNAAASAAAHFQRWWRIARHPALNLALRPREFSIAWDFHGLPHDLNHPNRRMRTRTSGGVGGAQRANPAAPYPDPADSDRFNATRLPPNRRLFSLSTENLAPSPWRKCRRLALCARRPTPLQARLRGISHQWYVPIGSSPPLEVTWRTQTEPTRVMSEAHVEDQRPTGY